MNIFEKLVEKMLNAFKGMCIFCVIYIILSGNGETTFFAWVLVGLSVLLTRLFMDERKNKIILAVVTICLGEICCEGFGRDFPFLLAIVGIGFLYYKFKCKEDIQEFREDILKILNKRAQQFGEEENTILNGKWSATNIFNPFERYEFSKQRITVKRGLLPFKGSIQYYPLAVLVNLQRVNIEKHLISCDIELPVSYALNVREAEPLVLKNVSRSKCKELERILRI